MCCAVSHAVWVPHRLPQRGRRAPLARAVSRAGDAQPLFTVDVVECFRCEAILPWCLERVGCEGINAGASTHAADRAGWPYAPGSRGSCTMLRSSRAAPFLYISRNVRSTFCQGRTLINSTILLVSQIDIGSCRSTGDHSIPRVVTRLKREVVGGMSIRRDCEQRRCGAPRRALERWEQELDI